MNIPLSICNAIFFLVILILSQYKKKEITITSYLLLVWFVSAIFSIFYVSFNTDYISITLIPYLYFGICFLISIYPISRFNTSCLKHIRIGNVKFLNFLIIFLASISVLPFLENLIHLFYSYTGGNNESVLVDLYKEKMGADFDRDEYVTWLSSVGFLFNKITLKFKYINLLLLFYYLIKEKPNKFILVGLLMLVFNPILFSLSMAGRGPSVFFLLYAAFFVVLFKNTIPVNIYKKIVQIGLIIIVVTILGLSILTISRFNQSSLGSETVFAWISVYLGEGIVDFNEYMWNIETYTEGDNSFAFIKNMLGFETFIDYLERREYWSASVTGISPLRFYTYIGDWFSDLGPYFTLLLIVIFSFFMRSITSNKASISFISLYLFVSFYQMILCGFTFYPYKTYQDSSNLFFNLIICGIISFSIKKKTIKVNLINKE